MRRPAQPVVVMLAEQGPQKVASRAALCRQAGQAGRGKRKASEAWEHPEKQRNLSALPHDASPKPMALGRLVRTDQSTLARVMSQAVDMTGIYPATGQEITFTRNAAILPSLAAAPSCWREGQKKRAKESILRTLQPYDRGQQSPAGCEPILPSSSRWPGLPPS